MCFKPGSETIGLDFWNNTLAVAFWMENETGSGKTLGKFNERRVMTEA